MAEVQVPLPVPLAVSTVQQDPAVEPPENAVSDTSVTNEGATMNSTEDTPEPQEDDAQASAERPGKPVFDFIPEAFPFYDYDWDQPGMYVPALNETLDLTFVQKNLSLQFHSHSKMCTPIHYQVRPCPCTRRAKAS